MLRRQVGSVAIAAVLMVMGLHNAPAAEASPQLKAGCLDASKRGYGCKISVEEPGAGGSQGISGSSGGSGGEPKMCKADNGFELPCEEDGYTWMGSDLQYCKVLDVQPPKSDPIWAGNTTGAIWNCAFNEMTTLSTLAWFPSADPVQPDPAVLAKQAVAQLGLRAIEIGIAPRALETDPNSMGAVGMPNWMWVANPGPQTTESQSRTVSENGWSVTISSNLRQVVWDMGDGGPEVIPLEFTTTGTVRIGEIQTAITKSKP